jgi:hypothetical protein
MNVKKITIKYYDEYFHNKMKWYVSPCSVLECLDEIDQEGDNMWDIDEIGFWL